MDTTKNKLYEDYYIFLNNSIVDLCEELNITSIGGTFTGVDIPKLLENKQRDFYNHDCRTKAKVCDDLHRLYMQIIQYKTNN